MIVGKIPINPTNCEVPRHCRACDPRTDVILQFLALKSVRASSDCRLRDSQLQPTFVQKGLGRL